MKNYPYLSTLEVTKDPLYRRISVSGFFKAFGQAVLTGAATMNPVAGAVKGSNELIKNTNSAISNEHRAFELILNGIEAACEELIQTHQLTCTPNAALLLEQRLGEKSQEIDIKITSAFFDAPQELPALQALVPVLEYWLEGINMSSSEAKEISQQLPTVFFRTVALEWGKRRSYYKPILQVFDNPFTKAWEERYHLEAYYEELRGLFHQPALGDELLPLSKIYIEPDFLVYEKCINYKQKNDYYNIGDDFYRSEAFQQSIHYYVNKWLNSETPLKLSGQNLLFILGQPGQGKSSFCYKTLADLLSDRNLKKKIYFIRLRDLSTEPDLIDKPLEVFKEYLEDDNYHHLSIDYKDSILILDGLDELYMSGGITNKGLSSFYKRLEHKAKSIRGFQIILTSRYNYLNVMHINTTVTTILKLAPMNVEHQVRWLNIYQQAHPTCILTEEKLLEIDQEKELLHLKELIQQPILLHLIAKANLDIKADYDKSTIYNNLFDTVIKREWDGGQLDKYLNINKKHLRVWLQEIAFNIHQSENEYIHHNEIVILESSKALNSILDTPEKMEDALKDLLVAFYFRNVVAKDERQTYPVEFLHKSLQEYLSVEYMWEKLIDLGTKNPSDIQILKVFSDLFSQKPLNSNMRELFRDIIQNTKESSRNLLRENLKRALPFCLRCQFLYDYNAESDKNSPFNKIEACFKSFWLILSHLSINQHDNEDLVKEKYKQNITDLLRQFGGVEMNLSHLDLEGIDLSHINLDHANLEGANLRRVIVDYASLRSVDLRGVSFIGVNFRHVNLEGAYMRGANMSNINVFYVNLRGANLRGANLRGTNIKYSNLEGVDLLLAKTDKANFFENLYAQGCTGIDKLSLRYYVDEIKHYEHWDVRGQHHYYLIREH